MSKAIDKKVLLSLEDKITLAENIIIEEYMKNNGNIFLSFSGGKDSTILRHIALRLFPELRSVFSNTTNELNEVVRYVKTFSNIITVFPKMTFKKVMQTKGFPLISKEVSQKADELKYTNGKKTRMLRFYGNKKGDSKQSNKWYYLSEQKFDITNKCCDILKKDPLNKWAKENGNPKPLIALMSDESRLRQQLALYGKEGTKIYPFLRTGWTEKDIWAYAEKFNIRFAECYYDRWIDGILVPKRDRTGCEFCMFGIDQEKEDRFERSRILSPKKYENTMNLENNGVKFSTAMNIALNAPEINLGLYGGEIKDTTGNKYLNTETAIYKINTFDKTCTACGEKGSTKIKRDIQYISSFIDIPNPLSKQKRTIECHYWWNECNKCGMTLINDLHLFDLRFNVTKRLIDYIYKNLDKKSELDISNETGLCLEDVVEIVHFYYNKAFRNARKNKRDSIWFDEDNNLIKVA